MTNSNTLGIILVATLLSFVSAQDCAMETAALTANAEVSGAFAAMQAAVVMDVSGDFGQYCSIQMLGCSVDFDDYSDAFVTACETAGGNVLMRTVEIVCRGDINGATIPVGFTLAVENVPWCIGTSCDANSLPGEVGTAVEAGVNAAAQAVELVLEQATEQSLECSGDVIGGEGSSPSTGTAETTEASAEVSTTAASAEATSTTPVPMTMPTAPLTPEPTTPATAPPIAPIAAPVDASSMTSSAYLPQVAAIGWTGFLAGLVALVA